MLEIRPGPVRGTIDASPSKSETHRAVLIAGLCDGPVVIERPLLSADTLASIRAIEAFGCSVERRANGLVIEPARDSEADVHIDCGNSGTTLRLAAGLAASRPGMTELDGDTSLRSRPMKALLASLVAAGVSVSSVNERAPVVIRGPLRSRKLRIEGRHSSQFISALLLALTADGGGGTLDIMGELVSAPYLEMTLRALGRFGVQIERSQPSKTQRRLLVPEGARPSATKLTIPGDWSSAAFMLCAGALGGSVRVESLPPVDTQGDGAVLRLLAQMGAPVTGPLSESRPAVGWAEVRSCSPVGIEANLGDCPDLFPMLAVTLAHAKGPSRLWGAPHLRGKETDRIDLVARNLSAQGIESAQTDDGLCLEGGARLKGGPVLTGGDHRILMAFAVGATRADAPVFFEDPDPDGVVGVSYPSFLADLAQLGVDIRRY